MFVQTHTPGSAEHPRPSTNVFNASGYSTVRSAAADGRCYDVYMADGTTRHKKLAQANTPVLKALATQVQQQVQQQAATRKICEG